MPKVKVSDISMNYEEMGDPNGEPLLILGGWSKISLATERYKKIFGDSYRIIRQEHRGMGETDAPETGYTIEQMATDIIGLLDQLKIKKTRLLAAGGMGAQMGMYMTATWPDRFQSLMLGAACAKLDYYAKTQLKVWADMYRLSPELWARAITLVDYTYETWAERPEVVNKAMEGRFKNDPFASADVYDRFVKTYSDFDATDYLGKIRCPTMIVCGGYQDRITGPQYAREVFARIAGAKLHIIHGASHAFQGEQMEEFKRVATDWFARH